MKAVFGLFGVLAILGATYVLAFLGIIPVQKVADKNPSLATTLSALHLAKTKKPAAVATAAAAVSPKQQALEDGQKKLAADQAQLAKDRTAFETEKQQADAPASGSVPGVPPGAPAAADNSAKLSAIYATMSADDISHIFGKLPDPDVIQALTQLDEKKAGQVLAGLPVDRAARLSLRMAHTTPKLQAAL